jgi:hypothetical protein
LAGSASAPCSSVSLRANEVVPSEQLLMDLWVRTPRPAQRISAGGDLTFAAVSPPGRLITRRRLCARIFPEELDVSQFEQLVSRP